MQNPGFSQNVFTWWLASGLWTARHTVMHDLLKAEYYPFGREIKITVCKSNHCIEDCASEKKVMYRKVRDPPFLPIVKPNHEQFRFQSKAVTQLSAAQTICDLIFEVKESALFWNQNICNTEILSSWHFYQPLKKNRNVCIEQCNFIE